MKRLILGGVLVVATASFANADTQIDENPVPGSHWQPEARRDVWIDFAVGTQSNAPGDNVRYSGTFIRFAPQVSISELLYLGTAFSAAKISNADGMVAYVQCPSNFSDDMCDALQHDPYALDTGTILAPQVFMGARARTGAFMGAFELAPTVRFTNGNITKQGLSVTTEQFTVEAHAKLDAWFTPYTTVGLYAGVDVDDIHNYQAALQLGVHLYPYGKK